MGKLSGRITLMFIYDHLLRLCCYPALNSFTHQKTGDQPLEQPSMV